ncbi:MAG: 3-dehydroquinate synthase [Clostridia bacterium]
MIIKVQASSEYDVILKSGALSSLGELCRPLIKGDTIAVITDSNVDILYSQAAVLALREAGFNVIKFAFSAGEKSKNINTYAAILNFLAQNEVTRKDCIVALGGGVVGDIGGFVAATYLRGISYVQVPTTLLSIIDSSVGGKTGIDLVAGKNLAGAFYQPKLVVADTQTLKTLSKTEIKNGMGELLKYGILAGGKLWERLQKGDALTEDTLRLCIEYKRDIVEADERESGKRMLLNLGHTPAHAIEKLSDYGVPHGYAVGAGLAIIAKLSLKYGLAASAYDEIIKVIKREGLPLSHCYSAAQLAYAAANDKKSAGDNITLVLIRNIGDCFMQSFKHKELEELFI